MSQNLVHQGLSILDWGKFYPAGKYFTWQRKYTIHFQVKGMKKNKGQGYTYEE